MSEIPINNSEYDPSDLVLLRTAQFYGVPPWTMERVGYKWFQLAEAVQKAERLAEQMRPK
jgi:hypothetical protein